MKRPLMISISLNQSPARTPRGLNFHDDSNRNLFLTGVREDSSSRVEVVLDRCLSLREDLSSNYRRLKERLDESLSQLHQVRRGLNSTSPHSWKDSSKYLQGKARIKEAEQEENDRNLDAQVAMLHQLTERADFSSKRVKLTLLKTLQEKGKKARNVHEQLLLSMRMVDNFSIAHQLGKAQRPFGSLSPPETEGVFSHLKDETVKCEKEHKVRGLTISNSPREQCPSIATTLNRRTMAETRQNCMSPLQSYLQRYQERRFMGETLVQRRRKAVEEKMGAIQPSPEVLHMSQKYLPKHFRQDLRLRPAPNLNLIPPPAEMSESISDASSTESREQNFIADEIQKELSNIGSLLRIATMVKEKNRLKLTRRSKKK